MSYKIKEMLISYYSRTWGEGKKVDVWDAWLDFRTIVKYRFIKYIFPPNLCSS